MLVRQFRETDEQVEVAAHRLLDALVHHLHHHVALERRLVRQDGEIDTVQAILLAAKADDLRDFADGFENFVIPELKSSIGQCRSDTNFVPAFTEFLRREGVSEEALEWVGPVLALSQVIDAQQ